MAAVRCSTCGEELLGAVNRCWRCGTAVVAISPAAVSASQPGELSGTADVAVGGPTLTDAAGHSPTSLQRPVPRLTTAELIDARRAGMMAMGGTVTSLFLGVFSAAL